MYLYALFLMIIFAFFTQRQVLWNILLFSWDYDVTIPFWTLVFRVVLTGNNFTQEFSFNVLDSILRGSSLILKSIMEILFGNRPVFHCKVFF
jgi:hypothetical protein